MRFGEQILEKLSQEKLGPVKNFAAKSAKPERNINNGREVSKNGRKILKEFVGEGSLLPNVV